MADTGNTIADQFAGFGLGFQPEAHVVKFRGQFDDLIIDPQKGEARPEPFQGAKIDCD